MGDRNDLIQLPDGWVWKQVQDVSRVVPIARNKIMKKNYVENGRIPVVDQGQGLIGGFTNQDDLAVDIELPVIVFGDHTRAIKYVDFRFVAGADGIKVLKPSPEFHPKLFYHFLRSLKLPDKGYARHYKFLKKSYLPLPPASQQQKIAAMLDATSSGIEKTNGELSRVSDLTRMVRMAILSKALRGNLTERGPNDKPADILLDKRGIQEKNESRKTGTKGMAMPYAEEDLPRGWAYSTLSQIGKIVTGMTPSKKRPSYYSKKHPFFKPGDLNAGYSVEVSVDGLSDEGIKRARIAPPRSVLVTCIGATIGKSGYTRVAGAFNQQINAIIPYQEVMPEYLYFAIISPEFQRIIRQSSSSTTLPILNKTKFSNLPIPVPPKKEQERIVNKIEACFGAIDRLDESVKRAAKSLETIDRTLIDMALLGNL